MKTKGGPQTESHYFFKLAHLNHLTLNRRTIGSNGQRPQKLYVIHIFSKTPVKPK